MTKALLAALLLVAPQAIAQRLTGTVRATGTLSLMSEVTITVLDSVRAAIAQGQTDKNGRYELSLLPDARQIRATKIGYRPLLLPIPPGRGDATVDVTMEVLRELDTVVTNAPVQRYNVPRLQDFEKRRLSGMGGYFVAEDDLRKSESVSMPSILRSRVPGLRFASYRGQTFASSISSPTGGQSSVGLNGPRGCWVSVYLDGLLIFDGRLRGSETPPDIGNIFAMNLSGVEYYGSAGSTPLQFKNTINTCGTLLFWTRGR